MVGREDEEQFGLEKVMKKTKNVSHEWNSQSCVIRDPVKHD